MKKRILRVFPDREKEIYDDIIEESWISLNLNGENYFKGIILKDAIEYFVIGFLKSEGLITSKLDIEKFSISDGVASVQVKSKKNNYTRKGKEQDPSPLKSNIRISKRIVFQIGSNFDRIGKFYKTTGGVHVCALYSTDGELIFYFEDISRRNAFDKVVGKAMSNDISLIDKIIMTSGRMSSDMIYKVARAEIPIIISKSAPTDLAISTANRLKINMIGFLRGNRFNVYTDSELFIKH